MSDRARLHCALEDEHLARLAIDWDDFRARVQSDDATAPLAAPSDWAFLTVPALVDPLQRLLEEAPSTGPLADPPPTGPCERHTERYFQAWLADQPGTDSPRWLQRQVRWTGRWVHATQRDAWTWRQHAPRPEDEATAALWAQWFAGDAFSSLDHWSRTFYPAAQRSFRAVMARASVPPDVRGRVIDDLRDGFRFAMHGNLETPGWWDLAARVLETAGPLPILARCLDDELRGRIARCAVHRRGGRARALAALLPDCSPTRRAEQVEPWLTPEHIEALADAELLARLLEHWSEGRHRHPDSIGHLIVQVRGRMRSTLRGLVAAHRSDALLEQLLALEGLTSRTEVAVARLAERWAYRELSLHFAMDAERPLLTVCRDELDLPEPITADHHATVRTWVLLVVLRGRLRHLESWLGDRALPQDSTWDRLLTQSVPPGLTDGGTGRVRGYRRLRDYLSDQLDELLLEIARPVRTISRLTPGRDLKQRVHEVLRPLWDERVPLPMSGFPRMIEAASEATAVLDDRDLS